MANPLRGQAAFDVDGEAYTLVMDVNALAEAEDALGMDIDLILAKYGQGTSVRLVRALVWAGLREKHPCSIEQAGKLVSGAGFLVAKAVLEKALLNAMPPAEAAKDENPRKRGRAGTG